MASFELFTMCISYCNLGVIFDSTLNMVDHASKVCKSAFFQLHKIGKIRKYLTTEAAKQVIHSLVISRLDYANAVLVGQPKVKLQQLQYVQNSAARLITKTGHSEHITPVLKSLHWLPIEQRIKFKVLLLTYKAMNGLAPIYLQELIMPHNPTRTLRSSEEALNTISPQIQNKNLWRQVFQCGLTILDCGTPYVITKISISSIFQILP